MSALIPKRRGASLPKWQVVALLAPLVLLAALGLRGLQADRAAAREEAVVKARRALARAEAEWPPMWTALSNEYIAPAKYASTPVPVVASAGYTKFEEAMALQGVERAAALARLSREDLQSSAPSGLPLAPLVAWARLKAETEPEALAERTTELLAAAVKEHLSILTPELLERTAEFLARRGGASVNVKTWQERWAADEGWRAVLQRELPSISAELTPRWLEHGGESRWLDRRDDGVLLLIPEQRLREGVRAIYGAREFVPDFVELNLRLGGKTLVGRDVVSGDVLAEERRGSLHLVAWVGDAAALYASAQRQMYWLAALLCGALIVEIVALWALRRSLAREAHLSEMKNAFVSSVSHELRAPVASIRLMAENLESGTVAEPERCRAYHRLMAEECRRLSVLIDNVLDLARIEQQRRPYHFAETDLAALARDAVEFMRPQAAERGQTLECELEELERTCDGLAVRQALVNLLDNAAKFSPAGTVTHVRLMAQDGGRWLLSVRDHGPGIPPAEHARIFERFYRLGDELRRETRGTGIGLSIVRHIVEAHGGAVELESEPGRGANFTLVFPDVLPPHAQI